MLLITRILYCIFLLIFQSTIFFAMRGLYFRRGVSETVGLRKKQRCGHCAPEVRSFWHRSNYCLLLGSSKEMPTPFTMI